MNKVFKIISLLVCSVFVAVCAFSTFNDETISLQTRNIELVESDLKIDSQFKSFDSYELEYLDGKVDFIGYDSIKLSDLYDFDLISDEELNNEVTTKYNCTYDYENGVVILNVSLIDGEESSIIDTIYGVILMNEEENYDVAFDCDGEVLLLSELEESEMIENCGFFSKLKKVWNTTAGKIGTIATVAACAVVGVVCAVVPGGQLITAACVGVAVGAIGGAVTAGVSTYISDGAVDWSAVGCYAGVGAVVGGVTSAAAYGITSAIKNSIIKSCNSGITENQAALKSIAEKSTGICDLNKQNHILQSKHAWTKVTNGCWDDVSIVIQNTIINGSATESSKMGTILFTYKYRGEIIEVETRIINGILRVVDAWVKTN